MARPDIAPVLAKEFVDLKIDTDRMKGADAIVTKWRGSAKGGIPWFVFIAADGTKGPVSEDAKGNNLGFPYQANEVVVFRDMLTKGCKKLTPEDIKFLGDSIDAMREAATKKAPAGGS